MPQSLKSVNFWQSCSKNKRWTFFCYTMYTVDGLMLDWFSQHTSQLEKFLHFDCILQTLFNCLPWSLLLPCRWTSSKLHRLFSLVERVYLCFSDAAEWHRDASACRQTPHQTNSCRRTRRLSVGVVSDTAADSTLITSPVENRLTYRLALDSLRTSGWQ